MVSCLFITTRWPGPLRDFRYGTALRLRMMLRSLQLAGFKTHLLCVTAGPRDLELVEAQQLQDDLRSLWQVSVVQVRSALHLTTPPPPRTGAQLWADYVLPALNPYKQDRFCNVTQPSQTGALCRMILEVKPDLIFAHRLPTIALLRRSSLKLPPIVFDLDDVETKAHLRSIPLPPYWRSKPLMYYLQYPWLANMQTWALRKASATLVCSDTDAHELITAHPSARVLPIPNAIPAPRASPLPEAKTVLFIGVYGHPPNLQAANLLVQTIWPRVLKSVPTAQLLIAGKGSERVAGYDAPQPRVRYLGFVDDLDALYERTRVVACPILSGSGTRIKIIEAALAGRPVVSTTIGAEGLVFDPAKGEIVHRDDPEEFADEVVRLLTDHHACSAMSTKAHAVAVREYSEATAIQKVAEVLRSCLPQIHGMRA